jgi:hypothetical protein
VACMARIARRVAEHRPLSLQSLNLRGAFEADLVATAARLHSRAERHGQRVSRRQHLDRPPGPCVFAFGVLSVLCFVALLARVRGDRGHVGDVGGRRVAIAVAFGAADLGRLMLAGLPVHDDARRQILMACHARVVLRSNGREQPDRHDDEPNHGRFPHDDHPPTQDDRRSLHQTRGTLKGRMPLDSGALQSIHQGRDPG